MKQLAVLLIFITTTANGFDFCPSEYNYVEGIGCIHLATYSQYPEGLDWYESYFYCNQMGGAMVRYLHIYIFPKLN